MRKVLSGLFTLLLAISFGSVAWGYMGQGRGPGGMWGPRWGGHGMQQMMDYCFERMSLAGWPGSKFGWWRGEGFSSPYRGASQLTKADAQRLLEQYLGPLRNPNLKFGKIQEERDRFVVDLQTKDGSLIDKLVVGKWSGQIRSIYR